MLPNNTPIIPRYFTNIKDDIKFIIASKNALYLVSLKCPAAFITVDCGILNVFKIPTIIKHIANSSII